MFVFGLDGKGEKLLVLKNVFFLSFFDVVCISKIFLEKTDFSFDRQC